MAQPLLHVTTQHPAGVLPFNRRMMVLSCGTVCAIWVLTSSSSRRCRACTWDTPKTMSDWPDAPQHEFPCRRRVAVPSAWAKHGPRSWPSRECPSPGFPSSRAITRTSPICALNAGDSSICPHRRGTQTPVHGVCVHLSPVRSIPQEQMEALSDYLDTLTRPEDPLIIAGDFSDWRNQTDDHLAQRLGPGGGLRRDFRAAGQSFPAALPVFRLDHLSVDSTSGEPESRMGALVDDFQTTAALRSAFARWPLTTGREPLNLLESGRKYFFRPAGRNQLRSARDFPRNLYFRRRPCRQSGHHRPHRQRCQPRRQCLAPRGRASAARNFADNFLPALSPRASPCFTGRNSPASISTQPPTPLAPPAVAVIDPNVAFVGGINIVILTTTPTLGFDRATACPGQVVPWWLVRRRPYLGHCGCGPISNAIPHRRTPDPAGAATGGRIANLPAPRRFPPP